MNNSKFTIGLTTVILLVVLRIGFGFHFFYEGVWKIKHHDEFTAEPFLSQAKGPIAPLFYAMLDDIDGRQRLGKLEAIEAKDGKPKPGKPKEIESVRCEWLSKRWDNINDHFVAFYTAGMDSDKAKELKTKAGEVAKRFKDDVEQTYLPSVIDDIQAFYKSLDRYEHRKDADETAPFQKKRSWDEMMKLRGEAHAWIKELEKREEAYKKSLYALLDDETKKKGEVPKTWNPLEWSRVEQINFAVTYALTAIGFCLLVGLCSRLAALGGAAFMCFVIMTQPVWPGIYPADHPVVGHALLIDKNVIYMLAMLVVASVPAGRWAGLDFFLYHLIGKRFLSQPVGEAVRPRGNLPGNA